jgi:dTDP-D-glucose 4,6-dehydratase
MGQVKIFETGFMLMIMQMHFVKYYSKGKKAKAIMLVAMQEVSNLDVVRNICRLLDELSPRPGMSRYEEQIDFVADRPGHDYRYCNRLNKDPK